MNTYCKIQRTRQVEIIEISESNWLSITKKTNIADDPLFEVYSIFYDDKIYDDTVWWKQPNNKCSKEEFESLKYEFLNWVDETFQR